MAESIDFNSEDSLSPAPTAPRKKRKVLVGVVFLLLATIWWFPRPNTTTEPVSYVRNADGSFSAEPGETADSGIEFGIDAGQLQATNNMSMSSSSSHSGSAWFACDHILVMNQSDHLLLRRTADSLVEELKNGGQFQSVQYYPTGHQPREGIEKPDLYLTLDLGSIEETGIPGTEVAATIKANLGTAPARSTNSHFDSQSVPTVNFNTSITLDHRSTFMGIESSGAKFRNRGSSIASALSEDIAKKIEDLKQKHPASAKLPSSMHPEWVKVDQFKFLKQFQAKQMFSTHGAFLKNDTFWQVEGVNIGEDLLKGIHAELKAADWRGEPPNRQMHYVRMSRDGQILTAFTERQRFNSGRSNDSDKLLKTDRFWIHNQSLLTKKERHSAFDDLLSEEPIHISNLLALKGMATSAQMDQIYETLKQRPPATVDAWLALANHYFHKKQQDDGITAIQCAHLLYQLRHGKNDGIRSLVNKQKLERSQVLVVTEKSLRTLGIVDATTLTEPVELAIGPERMAAVAAKTPDGKWNLLALVFGPENRSTGGAVEYTLTRVADHGSSWTTGAWHYSGDHTRIEKLGDTRVKIKTIQQQGTQCPSKVIFLPVTQSTDTPQP